MTTRAKSDFNLQGETWVDHMGDTYDYGVLKQSGWNAIHEGTVGKKYVVKLGLTKLDAPSPPFQTGDAGDWRD